MSDIRSTVRQISLFLVWIGFIVYATLWAPPAQPDTVDLLRDLVLGQWSDINPLIVALFNVMGLWPVLYASVALADGRSQSFPVWPFVVLSFGLGAFALLPYLALRKPYQPTSVPTGVTPEVPTATLPASDPWIKRTESRWVGISVLIVGLGLILFGVLTGSWADFWAEWQTRRFINIMSLDFCALTLLFPLLLGDDMKRRGVSHPWPLAATALLPLVGPALYLCIRPRLAEHSL